MCNTVDAYNELSTIQKTDLTNITGRLSWYYFNIPDLGNKSIRSDLNFAIDCIESAQKAIRECMAIISVSDKYQEETENKRIDTENENKIDEELLYQTKTIVINKALRKFEVALEEVEGSCVGCCLDNPECKGHNCSNIIFKQLKTK